MMHSPNQNRLKFDIMVNFDLSGWCLHKWGWSERLRLEVIPPGAGEMSAKQTKGGCLRQEKLSPKGDWWGVAAESGVILLHITSKTPHPTALPPPSPPRRRLSPAPYFVIIHPDKPGFVREFEYRNIQLEHLLWRTPPNLNRLRFDVNYIFLTAQSMHLQYVFLPPGKVLMQF